MKALHVKAETLTKRGVTGMSGHALTSATRKFKTPLTRMRSSHTAKGSSAFPILHVDVGWYIVMIAFFTLNTAGTHK